MLLPMTVFRQEQGALHHDDEDPGGADQRRGGRVEQGLRHCRPVRLARSGLGGSDSVSVFLSPFFLSTLYLRLVLPAPSLFSLSPAYLPLSSPALFPGGA